MDKFPLCISPLLPKPKWKAAEGRAETSSHGLLPLPSSSQCVERRKNPFCFSLVVDFHLRSTHIFECHLTDFRISAELKGNKQAQDIKAGVGSLGGLKKSL